MSNKVAIKDIISWFLLSIFVLLGVLNLIFIHLVPGIFYLAFSLFFCPPLGNLARDKRRIKIAYWIKIIVAFFVLWGTLAVGELTEYFESRLIH